MTDTSKPNVNRRALGTDTESQVARAYLDGYSIAAVGRMYRIGDGTVYRILDRLGVPRRASGIPAPKAGEGESTAPGAKGRGNAVSDRIDDEDDTLTPDDLAPQYARTIGRNAVRLEVWAGDDGMGGARLFVRTSSTGRTESFPLDSPKVWSLRILSILDTMGADQGLVNLRGKGARI